MVRRGFTLIELLVVIAIIGLLSTLTIISLNTARARARDTDRLSDVKQIRTALELYYNDMNDYPATLGTSITSTNGTYLVNVPVPTNPVDGACPPQLAFYTYAHQGSAGTTASYTIAYCLGATSSSIGGGVVQYATPASMK